MSFAENTSVPVERSKAELERLLAKYGAAVTQFELRARLIRVTLPLAVEPLPVRSDWWNHFRFRQARLPTNPTRPEPRSKSDDGSGVAWMS
jgi:hypothetical protein